jgi:hypothetical protein
MTTHVPHTDESNAWFQTVSFHTYRNTNCSIYLKPSHEWPTTPRNEKTIAFGTLTPSGIALAIFKLPIVIGFMCCYPKPYQQKLCHVNLIELLWLHDAYHHILFLGIVLISFQDRVKNNNLGFRFLIMVRIRHSSLSLGILFTCIFPRAP